MTPPRSSLQISLKAAAVLFGIWYVIGLVLMTTHWIPREVAERARVWGDVVFLLLAASVTFLFSARLCGWGAAARISAVILMASAVAELFGAKTGYPFGQYQYTENLGPKILGLMPAIIPFCWLTIVLNAFWIVYYLFQRHLSDPSATLLMFIASASVAVLTDFNLEPVASLVKLYWIWFDGGLGYEGIPGLNFFGWWMVSFVVLNVVRHLLPEPFEISRPPWTSYALLAAINLLFALINFRAGFLLPVFIALNTFGVLGILLLLNSPENAGPQGPTPQ